MLLHPDALFAQLKSSPISRSSPLDEGEDDGQANGCRAIAFGAFDLA
jgi:hypothetical protein